MYFGDGMPKSKALLSDRASAVFLDDFVMSAVHLGRPAADAYSARRFEPVARYEPFYFKEFVAGQGSVLPRG